MTDLNKTSAFRKKKPLKKTEKDTTAKGGQSRSVSHLHNQERLRWMLLPLLSLLISILIYPHVLSKPKIYRVGDVAERDIKASRDLLIENQALTEKDREKALKEVLAVYDLDRTALNLESRIREAFRVARAFYGKREESTLPSSAGSIQEKESSLDIEDEESLQIEFFGILEIPADETLFKRLVKAEFPAEVEEATIITTRAIFDKGVVANKGRLEGQIEKGGIVLHDLASKKEMTVTDLDQFFDVESARRSIDREELDIEVFLWQSDWAPIVTALSKALMKPNLTFNQRETESRKDLSRASVTPVYFKVKKGEMLIREGERVEADHLLKLSAQAKSQSQVSLLGRVPAMAILLAMFFSVMYFVGSRGTRSFMTEDRHLLLDALTLLGLSIFVWAYCFVAEEIARGYNFFSSQALLLGMPIACGAMLVSVFQGISNTVIFCLSISVVTALVAGGQVEFFVYFFISSLVSGYGVRNCKERGVLIKTGLTTGLMSILLALSIVIIMGSFTAFEVFIAACAALLGGILSGVIATGILPLIEMAFGFTTDIKLLELASLDQPLLRELMVQAPGSYHHSVITGNMVEATAKAVNANPLLARVSAYYHDIGKIRKPLYFVENQRSGENKHEKLAPSMSSLILISHVKDGVEMAREHKLGKEIMDIIQQHHGTNLIPYFYHKAKDRMAKKEVKTTDIKEEDFRYPGPKPQTKEAGLVMLADMVEAASRSLVDPTPARIQGTVQKIINKVFSDGQLDDCELTLKDLHEIAKSFNNTLSGIFHHRIEYPDQAPKHTKKGKNGNTDYSIETDQRPGKSDDQREGGEGLKRLGLS